MRRMVAVTSLVAAFFQQSAHAVTAPYSDNFDSYANGSQPANFVSSFNPAGAPPSGASWSISNPNGTNGSFEGSVYGHGANTSAAVNVSNIGNAGFTLSTTFVVQFPPGSSQLSIQYVGLGAAATSPDFSSNGYQLFYDIHDGNSGIAGNLFLSVGGTNHLIGGSGSFSSTGIPFITGTTYTMTLQGTYTTNGLVLSGTLTDGTNTIFANGSDPSPPQGSYFGYYESVTGDTQHVTSQTVNFDNFSIDVPEITTIAALGIGSALLLFLARRRATRS
jgi:hypothetical protein